MDGDQNRKGSPMTMGIEKTKPRVTAKGTVSKIPYAMYEGGVLLGYADDEKGPIVLSPQMQTLPEPIEVEVVDIDTSAWD